MSRMWSNIKDSSFFEDEATGVIASISEIKDIDDPKKPYTKVKFSIQEPSEYQGQALHQRFYQKWVVANLSKACGFVLQDGHANWNTSLESHIGCFVKFDTVKNESGYINAVNIRSVDDDSSEVAFFHPRGHFNDLPC